MQNILLHNGGSIEDGWGHANSVIKLLIIVQVTRPEIPLGKAR